MRVGIIGAGAIGCLFGALLKTAGNDVLLVHRDATIVSHVRRYGVRVRELDGTTLRTRVPIARAPADLQDFKLVLFGVKAYSTREAALQHRGSIGRDTTILTLQNGLGNVEVLSRLFGPGRVVAGSTTEGSLSLGPGSIAHTGRGRTVVGELDDSLSTRCSDIVAMLTLAGFRSSITQNVGGVIWAKVAVNAAINPVSAITRLPNGELAQMVGLRQIMHDVLEEGVRVARAERVSLEPNDPASLLLPILRWTGRNKSSMLQDVENRRKTEIRQLNGAIVERGGKKRIRTPFNELLARLVVRLERTYLSQAV